MGYKKESRLIGIITIIIGLLEIGVGYTLGAFEFTQDDIIAHIGLIVTIASLGIISLFSIFFIISEIRKNKDKLFIITQLILIVAVITNVIGSLQIETFIRYTLIGAGALVLIESFRRNKEDKKNKKLTTSLIIVIIISIICTIGAFANEPIKKVIYDYRNRNEVKYDESFFDNLPELNIKEAYINVKKDGKFGYINNKGKTVIDFKYDYATDFKNIQKNGKEYEVALVQEGERIKIILKDETVVVSYYSKPFDGNYNMKYQTFWYICISVLGKDAQENFFNPILNAAHKTLFRTNLEESEYESKDETVYIYKYDYSNTDFIQITETYKTDDFISMGNTEPLKTKYEIVKKQDTNSRIVLDCEKLDYNIYELYIYRSGEIPFFNPSENEQGWFDQNGKKNTIKGNIRILDIRDNSILVQNRDTEKYYFINNQRQIISDKYTDIETLDNNYIVKKQNGKCAVIDMNFKQILGDYDLIYSKLYNHGIYIVANLPQEIEFNESNLVENIDYQLFNLNGKVVSKDKYQQVYPFGYVCGIFLQSSKEGKITEKDKKEKTPKYLEAYQRMLDDLHIMYVGRGYVSSHIY